MSTALFVCLAAAAAGQLHFGIHGSGGDVASASYLGTDFVRVFMIWQDLEPQPGVYDTSGLDQYIRSFQERGINVVMTLRPVSVWGADVDYLALAISHPERPWRRFSGPPRDMEAWIASVRLLVERYNGDGVRDAPRLIRPVKYWQICNEPLWQWQGSLEQYVSFLDETDRAIRHASPGAETLCGAITGLDSALSSNNLPLLGVIDRMTRAIEPHCDIIDWHCYNDDPDSLAAQVEWIHERTSKPLWTMENAGPFEIYSEQLHAEHVIKRHTIAFAAGVRAYFWSTLYPTRDPDWADNYPRLSLIDPDGQPKPAFYTYRLLAEKTASAWTISAVKSPPGTSIYVADTPAGDVYVAWADTDVTLYPAVSVSSVLITHIVTSRSRTIPRTELIHVSGGRVRIALSATPIFIEEIK